MRFAVVTDFSIGILGLGFPDSSIPSWIVEAYQRSLIPAPAFSLNFGRYIDYNSGQPTDGNLLVIGGYDQDLVDGSINWIKCSGTKHFQIPLDGIILNGDTIERRDNLPLQAIIDVHYILTFANLVRHRRLHYRSYIYCANLLQSYPWFCTVTGEGRLFHVPVRCTDTSGLSVRRTKLYDGRKRLYLG